MLRPCASACSCENAEIQEPDIEPGCSEDPGQRVRREGAIRSKWRACLPASKRLVSTKQPMSHPGEGPMSHPYSDNDSKKNASNNNDGSASLTPEEDDKQAVETDTIRLENASPCQPHLDAPTDNNSADEGCDAKSSIGSSMRVMVSAVNSHSSRENVTQQCMLGPWERPIGVNGADAFAVQSPRRMSWMRKLPRVVLNPWYNVCIFLMVFSVWSVCMFEVQRTYTGRLQETFNCQQPFARDLYRTLLCLIVLLVSDYMLACLVFFTVNILYFAALGGVATYVMHGLLHDSWPCGSAWDMGGYVALFAATSYWIPRLWMTSPRWAKMFNVIFKMTTFEIRAFIALFKQTRIVLSLKMNRIKHARVTHDQKFVATLHAQAEEALRSGSLKLLSGRMLFRRYYRRGTIRNRQELEKDDTRIFLSPEDAVKCFNQHLRIVAISYPWITPSHPDPERFHMNSILSMLPVYLFYNVVFGCWQTDVGVFWDYACLPQGSSRTEEEQRQFDQGLAAINVLYGSPHSLVIKLRDMPTEDLKSRYESSGWCTFESEVARMIKAPEQVIDEMQTRSARKYTWIEFLAKVIIRSPVVEIVMLCISVFVVSVGSSWGAIMKILFYSYLGETLVKAFILSLTCMVAPSSFFFQMMINTLVLFFFHTNYRAELFGSSDTKKFSFFFFFIFRYYSLFDSLLASCRSIYELQMANETSYKPPVPPEEMRQLLQTKHFTNGSDYDFVCKKYEKFFLEMAHANTRLDFSRSRHAPGQVLLYHWGSEDVLRLASVLPYHQISHGKNDLTDQSCQPLTVLKLEGRFLGDQEMVGLVRSLPASLETLDLHNCLFGEAGLQELADALSRLDKLTNLTLPSYLVNSCAGAKIEAMRGSLRNIYGSQFWGYQDHFCSLLLNPLYVPMGPLKVAI